MSHRRPGTTPSPERVAAWRRLEEVRERLRIGYHAHAPEDLSWAVEQLLRLWDIERRRARLQELLEAEERRVADLHSQTGRLLVQNDRLRLEIERLRATAPAAAGQEERPR